MIDALKRASAKRITVVLPFYGYARQDKKHRGREPISARLMADLFKTAGADRLMAVDLHTAQIQGFFDGPVDHLMAMPILAEYVAREVRPPSTSPSSRPTPAASGSPSSGPTPRRRPAGLHPQDPRHQPSQPGRRQPGRRRDQGPRLRARRRHDRHRRHHHQGGRGADGARRQGRRHRRDARHPLRPGRRPSQGLQVDEVVVTNTLPIPEDRASTS